MRFKSQAPRYIWMLRMDLMDRNIRTMDLNHESAAPLVKEHSTASHSAHERKRRHLLEGASKVPKGILDQNPCISHSKSPGHVGSVFNA
ncbi:hypothetical protein NPIL_577381 [Nephila pilipes]|uniref:Uncharacterized protein n=1 Tax=Nephila pilipes TaxID=299642 RepID=A0A8X6TYB4_NEPPI|nr:hypothetical protein NPIL_577381 [Nephila pilipes]